MSATSAVENKTSAVEFKNDTRIHMGLHTTDLDRAIVFYTTLLGSEPVKIKSDYAKFETDDPSINLSVMTRGSSSPQAGTHYGIQVKSTDAVAEFRNRFESQGIAFQNEENTTCCYALQDKFWIADPDGNRWEVFVVLEDADTFLSEETPCCASETEKEGACC